MAKNPKWFGTTPTYVSHPASTLKHAAQVISESAKVSRKQGMKEFATAENFIANALLNVANGATWADAFELNNGDSE